MRKIVVFYAISVLCLMALHTRKDSRPVTAEPKIKEGKKTDQPDKFLQFHEGIRTREGQTSPQYGANYKWQELRRMRSNAFARALQSGRGKSNGVLEWRERGPANVPGRTRALLDIPNAPTPDTWLAGAATGGIWKTTDGGLTWVEKSRDFPVFPISSFAATTDGSVIYAGSGEFVSSFYSAIGNGIFVSHDLGETWAQLPSTDSNPDFSIVTRIIVDPDNANTLLATTVPHNMSIDATSAVMRSTDGGMSWSKALEVDGFLEQIISTPGNFAVQYAAQNEVGIWKSIDAGQTWILLKNAMNPDGRIEISVSPVNPNVLFAAVEGWLSHTGADLYYSSNAGSTWALIDIRFGGSAIDFFEGQGFYDNTVLAHPFNANMLYVGGVSLFHVTVGSTAGVTDVYNTEAIDTDQFLLRQAFADAPHDRGRLMVGAFADNKDVEIRFGPGKSQLAHRYIVPPGATSNVPAADYEYAGYTVVPFEVWDIVTNKQLTVAFRDQNRNGKFDLELVLSEPAREYIFINDVAYSPTPLPAMMSDGGHQHRLMYNLFPAAGSDDIDTNNLPDSKLVIHHHIVDVRNAITQTAADSRGSFDSKNTADQVDLENGVHADHHALISIVTNTSAKTFKLLLGNDGGVFVSKPSTVPGVKEGDWSFRGFGLNTSQFYGADKRPGTDQYIGGLQDNGTRISPATSSADAGTPYAFALGGDGYEVIWNNSDPDKILGTLYNGQVYRTIDGGVNWTVSDDGLVAGSEFPFVTRLAHSKNYPDRVFTAGASGVYVSENFGESWELSPVDEHFVAPDGSPAFLDVEVSRANANIVWAGSGMFSTTDQRFLHVSTDGGKSFLPTKNYTLVPMGTITSLASHPFEDRTAYALFSFAKAPKILRTTDLGENWHDISGFGSNEQSSNGFPDVAVFCLYVRPDNPDIIWVGTEIGIVESTDNGQTWELLPDFPNVAVWDMKGQDNQVVIATHGRGIWTATLESSQVGLMPPAVTASGTAPSGKMMLRIKSNLAFDSVRVADDSGSLLTLRPVIAGTHDIALTGISPGEKNIVLTGYLGAAPFQSMTHKMNHLAMLVPSNSYSNYFQSIEDVAVNGMSLQHFSDLSSQHKRSLMTNHPYSVNRTYEMIIRTPVTLDPTFPTLYYGDVAITEPAQDMVVVEATNNGLDWVPLWDPYGADKDDTWNAAFTEEREVTSTMLLNHELNFGESFSAGDSLVFRFRFSSGPLVTGWGWALDYVSIQEVPLTPDAPTAPPLFSIYPNPTTDVFTVEYRLKSASPVTVRVVDMFGRRLSEETLGQKNAGYNRTQLSADQLPSGTYLVIILTREGKKVSRLTVSK